MTDEVMQIFYAAQKAGKETLTLDEITAVYYNLFTKQDKTKKIKIKKEITLKLFNMKGQKGQQRSHRTCSWFNGRI